MDRGAWQATVHRVAQELDTTEVTWYVCMHTHTHVCIYTHTHVNSNKLGKAINFCNIKKNSKRRLTLNPTGFIS